MDEKKLITTLGNALEAAAEHLEFCGYGDSYERSISNESGLQAKIEDAKIDYELWKEDNQK